MIRKSFNGGIACILLSGSICLCSCDPDREVADALHAVVFIIVDGGLLLSSVGTIQHHGVHVDRVVEISGEHQVGVVEREEVLGGDLIRYLREHLPCLHVLRKVGHLPPEVDAIVVDGVNTLEFVEGIASLGLRSVSELVSCCLGSNDVHLS